MSSLLHLEFARSAEADAARVRATRAIQRTAVPPSPPGRTRSLVAHVLGAAAGRVERDVARRAVA